MYRLHLTHQLIIEIGGTSPIEGSDALKQTLHTERRQHLAKD